MSQRHIFAEPMQISHHHLIVHCPVITPANDVLVDNDYDLRFLYVISFQRYPVGLMSYCLIDIKGYVHAMAEDVDGLNDCLNAGIRSLDY